jgi:hypothetical protein
VLEREKLVANNLKVPMLVALSAVAVQIAFGTDPGVCRYIVGHGDRHFTVAVLADPQKNNDPCLINTVAWINSHCASESIKVAMVVGDLASGANPSEWSDCKTDLNALSEAQGTHYLTPLEIRPEFHPKLPRYPGAR